MAKIAKKTKCYPSDMTDEEWEVIAPLMPKPGRRGRPREVEFREVINAVRYLVRSGCGWRMLPIDCVEEVRGVARCVGRLKRAGRRHLRSGWFQRRCGDQLGELAQVLGGSGEEKLVFCAVWTSKAQPVESEDVLQVGEQHLDLLPLSA